MQPLHVNGSTRAQQRRLVSKALDVAIQQREASNVMDAMLWDNIAKALETVMDAHEDLDALMGVAVPLSWGPTTGPEALS